MYAFSALHKWRKSAEALRSARRVMVLWQNLSSSRALHSWQAWMLERQRAFQLLEQVAATLMGRSLWRALNSWIAARQVAKT